MNHDESYPLKDPKPVRTSCDDDVLLDDTRAHADQPELARADAQVHDEPSFGDRLRASRVRHGMSLPDCAHALRLPIRLLEKLESDDYQGIDYSVYLRGYLRKYAEHVCLDPAHLESQLASLDTRQPELVAGEPLPVWKRSLERYSSALTYMVLTAIIVVPLVWLGLNGVLKRNMARLEPLNATPVSTPLAQQAPGKTPASAVAARATRQAAGTGPSGQPPADATSAQAQKPLMASMAPFSAMQSPIQPIAMPSKAAEPTPPAAVDGTRLTVTLQQPSWVQITDGSGKRLEYALLPAGTHRAYQSDKLMNVRIGNAEGARVDVDGKPIALDSYRHAKVAHFDVESDGSIRPDNS